MTGRGHELDSANDDFGALTTYQSLQDGYRRLNVNSATLEGLHRDFQTVLALYREYTAYRFTLLLSVSHLNMSETQFDRYARLAAEQPKAIPPAVQLGERIRGFIQTATGGFLTLTAMYDPKRVLQGNMPDGQTLLANGLRLMIDPPTKMYATLRSSCVGLSAVTPGDNAVDDVEDPMEAIDRDGALGVYSVYMNRLNMLSKGWNRYLSGMFGGDDPESEENREVRRRNRLLHEGIEKTRQVITRMLNGMKEERVRFQSLMGDLNRIEAAKFEFSFDDSTTDKNVIKIIQKAVNQYSIMQVLRTFWKRLRTNNPHAKWSELKDYATGTRDASRFSADQISRFVKVLQRNLDPASLSGSHAGAASAHSTPVRLAAGFSGRPDAGFELTHGGHVFHTQTANFNYQGGRVVLASTEDGHGDVWTDDMVTLAISHSDGVVASRFSHDYSNNNQGSIDTLPPHDVTSHFADASGTRKKGLYAVTLKLTDLHHNSYGNSEYWLVELGAD